MLMRLLISTFLYSMYVFRSNKPIYIFFFFNDTATTEIYTLSLHDALPISRSRAGWSRPAARRKRASSAAARVSPRSEEHTSELQSQSNLVCRLLLEKKKNPIYSDKNSLRTLTEHTSQLRTIAECYTKIYVS